MGIFSWYMGQIFYKFDSWKMHCLAQYKSSLITDAIRNNVSIGGNTVFVCPERIFIGKNSYVNSGMLYATPDSKITIGDNCLISYNVHMRTHTHNHA